MTNSEFYTRAHNIIEDVIAHLPVDTDTKAYYCGVAAHIGVILVECESHHISQKECLFILRQHCSYKTSYKSDIKEAFRAFYRAFRELSLDLTPTFSDIVQTLRHQGYNTCE